MIEAKSDRLPAAGASRVIAVTGASRGIGACIALELARRGFTVGCFTRKGTVPETEGVSREAAERLVGCRCDVTDEASVRRDDLPRRRAGHCSLT